MSPELGAAAQLGAAPELGAAPCFTVSQKTTGHR